VRFVSTITTHPSPTAALVDIENGFRARLGDEPVHLAFVFVSAAFADKLETLGAGLNRIFPDAAVLGCTAEGTIGGGREVERSPSIAVLAASLPSVGIRPFHVSQAELEGATTTAEWVEQLGAKPDQAPIFIALADPFSFRITDFLDQVNTHYPGAPVFGGMASAARQPRENGLLLNEHVYREGLTGVALSGAIRVRAVVSQGCRPIGRPFVVTRGDQNVMRELGGKPALAALQEMSSSLPPEDLALAKQALLVGQVINEYQESFKRGDFLIHNLLGADPNSGALAIAGPVKVGRTIQFHVRDAKCADEDLRELLGAARGQGGPAPAGALLFSCNGRGTRMWPEAGHDVGVVTDVFERLPTAGCFCAGELGPIGQRNFIHGFTASIALFSGPDGPKSRTLSV